MLLRRLRSELRAQNWTSVAIELVIVVVGVFLGTQVSNWNQQRIDAREAQTLLAQIKPELRSMLAACESARRYYATTRAYAGTALAGWARRPGVTDEQFVIAAFQSTQIDTLSSDSGTLALIFGAGQFRNIADVETRMELSALMARDNADLHAQAVDTPYRGHVRSIIPDDIQQAIRARCGDRTQPGPDGLSILSPACALGLPAARAATVAAALRARPGLVDELNGQLAAEAVFLDSVGTLDARARRLLKRLDATTA